MNRPVDLASGAAIARRGIRKPDDQPCASAFATATDPAIRSPASRRVATNAVAEQAIP
jgi:hypothetical protein